MLRFEQANGGENPLTQKRVFSEEHTRMAMSLMLSCGMYDFSGEWASSHLPPHLLLYPPAHTSLS